MEKVKLACLSKHLFLLSIFVFFYDHTYAINCSDLLGLRDPLKDPKSLEEYINQRLQKSQNVIYAFQDTIVPIHRATLNVGKSYTLNLVEGHLQIGENIMGTDKRIGGQSSHQALADIVMEHPVLEWTSHGGAFRINDNGIIDVSGYHGKTPSSESAAALTYFLYGLFPQLRFRSTMRRLSTLPPIFTD